MVCGVQRLSSHHRARRPTQDIAEYLFSLRPAQAKLTRDPNAAATPVHAGPVPAVFVSKLPQVLAPKPSRRSIHTTNQQTNNAPTSASCQNCCAPFALTRLTPATAAAGPAWLCQPAAASVFLLLPWVQWQHTVSGPRKQHIAPLQGFIGKGVPVQACTSSPLLAAALELDVSVLHGCEVGGREQQSAVREACRGPKLAGALGRGGACCCGLCRRCCCGCAVAVGGGGGASRLLLLGPPGCDPGPGLCHVGGHL